MPDHHVLFSKRLWRAQEPTKALRSNHWLIVPITLDAHKELHHAVTIVPILDHFAADRVVRAFKPVQGNYLASIDQLLFAIEHTARSKKVRAVEVELAALCVYAIDLQRPIIRRGLLDAAS